MGILSKPKAPKETAEQTATARRTRSLLDQEIRETEEKFKALTRGKLGRSSLLGGAARTPQEAATGSRFRGGAGSLISPGARTVRSSSSSASSGSSGDAVPIKNRLL